MASIAEWIEKIKTAIYGEEVRGAIWQSLDAMNTQVDAINVDSAQIEQNKQDISTCKTNIATNTAAITVDSAQIEQNKTDIATNTAAITALNSSINFGVNTSAASTEKAVYIKAVADAVAETVGITTNKSILGYVFVSGIDAFSCMGAIRGRTIRMIIVASNAATYSVVRNSDGAVTYKEIAWVS